MLPASEVLAVAHVKLQDFLRQSTELPIVVAHPISEPFGLQKLLARPTA